MPGTRRAALIWGTLVSLAVAGQALAQTPPTPSAPPPPVTMVAPVQPVLVTPSVEFGFAPRFWYLFKDQAGVKAQNPLILNQGGDVQIPMGGGVGTARFLSMPDTTFSLSVLFGNVTATSSRLCAAPGTGPSPCDPKGQFNLSSTDAHSNVDRLDLEILAQTQIPNTPWGWIVGGRWEHQTSNDRSRRQPLQVVILYPASIFPTKMARKRYRPEPPFLCKQRETARLTQSQAN